MSDVRGWEFDASGGGTYRPPPSVEGHRHQLDAGDLDALAASLTSRLVPVGVVSPYVGTTAPTNWLICDGSTFSAATYPALNTLLGGNTLPNLKGRVVVGLDAAQTEFDVRGETGGAKTHTLLTAEMPVHTHTQNSHNHTQNAHGHSMDNMVEDGGSPASNRFIMALGGSKANAWGIVASTATNIAATATNQNTGSGSAHNNLQPYIAYNYIIKAA